MSQITEELREEADRLNQDRSDLPELDYFLELAGNLNARRARELAEASEEAVPVGTLCHFVPEELVRAAGAVPFRLCGGSHAASKMVDHLLPGRFCPLVKATWGWSMTKDDLWERLQAIISPTTCDAKLKLGELLAQDRPVWMLEVPATTETPQSRRLWFDSLQHLRRKLEGLTGQKVTAARLKEAVEAADSKREVIRGLYRLSLEPDPPLWGREILLVASLSFMDDPERWLTQAHALLEAARSKVDRSATPCRRPRLLLTGLPTAWPYFKLPRLMESVGGRMVVDEVCFGTKTMWDAIGPVSGGVTAQLSRIANGYLAHACACFSPNLGRLAKLRQYIREFNVEGVVYTTLPGCQVYGMETPRIKQALEDDGMPMLIIESDYGQEDWGPLSIRMEAFLELVEGRREGDDLF